MRERFSSSTERGDTKVLEIGTVGRPYVTFDRHDAYEALSTGRKTASRCTRGLKGGEVRLVSAPKASHTSSDGSAFYNGGCYLVPSWNAKTPAGTRVELEVRVCSGYVWTEWFDMGVWTSETESVARHSVNGQKSGNWQASTDTVDSIGLVFADAYQYRLTLLTEKWGLPESARRLHYRLGLSLHRGGPRGAV